MTDDTQARLRSLRQLRRLRARRRALTKRINALIDLPSVAQKLRECEREHEALDAQIAELVREENA